MLKLDKIIKIIKYNYYINLLKLFSAYSVFSLLIFQILCLEIHTQLTSQIFLSIHEEVHTLEQHNILELPLKNENYSQRGIRIRFISLDVPSLLNPSLVINIL